MQYTPFNQSLFLLISFTSLNHFNTLLLRWGRLRKRHLASNQLWSTLEICWTLLLIFPLIFIFLFYFHLPFLMNILICFFFSFIPSFSLYLFSHFVSVPFYFFLFFLRWCLELRISRQKNYSMIYICIYIVIIIIISIKE